MKKIWKKSLAFGLSLFMILESPFSFFGLMKSSFGAEQPASVQATSLNVRSGPGVGYSIVGKLDYGAQVMVINEAAASDGAVWYQIRFTGSGGVAATGYVLSTYIKFPATYTTETNFETYLTAQGFPESYRPGLRELHSRYPQWIFTAFDTGLDWNEVIQNESLVGMKLLGVEKLRERLEREGTSEIAVDSVGAGTGEIVIVCKGSSARYVFGNGSAPVDTSIVGIVDTVEVG